ncbi:MAG: hypothetical protein LBH30_01620, partial [Prevotellaceae bacterium]|nr:hypothetical protein [Prevotellaceae bacterium]
MKRIYITGIIIIITIFIYGCNSSSKNGEQSHKSQECVHDHDDDDHEDNTIAGIQTEILTPGTFRQVIKTGGQIQTPQGDETTVVSTTNGI